LLPWGRPWLVSLALCLTTACGKDESQTRGATGSTAKGGGGTVQLADASRKFLLIEPASVSENPQGRSYFGRTAFRPKALSAVTAPFAGRIATVIVEPGQRVKSGGTLFTLGYGDVTPLMPLGRILAVIEAGLGFGFLAMIIGYLPVIYQTFSRREAMIGRRRAEAGPGDQAPSFQFGSALTSSEANSLRS